MKKNNDTPHTILSRNPPVPTDPQLWDRILDWREKLSADKPLTSRLGRALAIGDDEVGAALLEYLRFTYLARTTPGGATPSKAVDEIWHTHLLFTRSYADFCLAAFGTHLHHEPGEGGADEDRLRNAYLRTLERYAAEFGEPPARWWPRPAVPIGRQTRRSGGAMPSLVALLGVTAALAAFGVRALAIGYALLVLTAVVVLVALAIQPSLATAGSRPGRRGRREEGSGGGCTSAPLAGLTGNEAGDDGGGGDDGAGSCGSSCGGGGCGG